MPAAYALTTRKIVNSQVPEGSARSCTSASTTIAEPCITITIRFWLIQSAIGPYHTCLDEVVEETRAEALNRNLGLVHPELLTQGR